MNIQDTNFWKLSNGDATGVSSSIHAINELRTAWCEISDERSSDLEVSAP